MGHKDRKIKHSGPSSIFRKTNPLMTVNPLPFDQIPFFSARDRAYTLRDPALSPYFKYPADLKAFGQVMLDKSREEIPRELLVRVVEEQYAGLERSEQTDHNIKALGSPDTFTVATAHQPVLFTGPLFFIYKIISTINLAKKLREAYPGKEFVPVMISGGEDHDFEEVNHANLFGRRLVWETRSGGSVGRMSAQELIPVLDQLHGLLGDSERAREFWALLKTAFTGHESYGEGMQYFVNSLFKDQGLLVLNMDHVELKRHFIPLMRRELLEQASQGLVEQTQAELEALGFPAQAYARPINLFYLLENARERIVREGDFFEVVNTDLRFSEEEMMTELEAHPDRFSPNVVMRPLYQESVLPNLAYIGGGGEIAYWLERKKQFEYFGLNFPVLVRRNSVLWIDSNSARRMEKLEVGLDELMIDAEELVKSWVHARSDMELSLAGERSILTKMFEDISERARGIDPTLVGAVLAEGAKQGKMLEQLEIRLLRAQKQRFETELGQLRALKDKLFPGNGLQERFDNFIPYYLKHGPFFFEFLLEHLDPLETSFVVIRE